MIKILGLGSTPGLKVRPKKNKFHPKVYNSLISWYSTPMGTARPVTVDIEALIKAIRYLCLNIDINSKIESFGKGKCFDILLKSILTFRLSGAYFQYNNNANLFPV